MLLIICLTAVGLTLFQPAAFGIDCDTAACDGCYIHNGVCVNGCPNGTYVDYERPGYCSDCHKLCSTCFGPSDAECLTCSYAQMKLQCVEVCPYWTVKYNGECIADCKGVLYSGECFDICPDKMYNESGYCRACHQVCAECSGPEENDCLSCVSETNVQFNGSCTESCPATAPYIEGGVCKVTCQQKSHGWYCVDNCPKDLFTFGHLCVDTCPQSHPYTTKDYVCVSQCEKYRYKNHCVEACPYFPMKLENDGECILEFTEKNGANDTSQLFCPDGTYMERNSSCVKCHSSCNGCHGPGSTHCDQCKFIIESDCVDACPKNAPYLDNTTITPRCLSKCNGTLKLDIEKNECVHYCKNKVEYNETCVNKCPGNMVRSKKGCVLHCKDSEYLLNSTCVQYCPSGYQYVINHTCSRRCPNGMVMMGINKTDGWPDYTKYHYVACLTSCPAHYAVDMNRCVETCPLSHPVVYNWNCVKECPKDNVLSKWYTYSSQDVVSRDDSNYHCLPACLKGYMVNPENSECIFQCPANFSFVYNHSCVSVCPNATFINRRIFDTDSNPSEVVISECMGSCPTANKHSSKDCIISSCPDGFNSIVLSDVSNICELNCPSIQSKHKTTCLTKCLNSTVYHLNQVKQTISCHSPCPSRRYVDIRSTSFSCESDCSGYIYNGQCIDKCPSNFPFLCKYDNTCYNKCPNDLYVNQSQYRDFISRFPDNSGHKKLKASHNSPVFSCTESYDCPSEFKTIPVDNANICINECPKEYPYVQDNFCFKHIPVTLNHVLLYFVSFLLYLPIVGYNIKRCRVRKRLKRRRQEMQVTKLD